jgi:hypothetical protein
VSGNEALKIWAESAKIKGRRGPSSRAANDAAWAAQRPIDHRSSALPLLCDPHIRQVTLDSTVMGVF